MELVLLTYLSLTPYIITKEWIDYAKVQSGINQSHDMQYLKDKELMDKKFSSKEDKDVVRDLRPNSTGKVIIYADKF